MKWPSHETVGIATAYALGFSYIGIFLCAVGCILPDWIEGGVARHRGLSHTWYVWLAAFVSVKALAILYSANPVIGYISIGVNYLMFGVLLHLATDALTPMGIPIWPHKRRWTMRLFRTGSIGEYVFVFCLCAVLLTLKFQPWR